MSSLDYKQGKALIEKKVADFSLNIATYKKKDFLETQVRDAFINSFFQALGWNFDQTHLHPRLWEVIPEFSQRTTGKRPDYAFRLNGDLKFFVEAKAPWVDLSNKESIFQAKRYAFSTNGEAPIVILTDFEEFKVFNALKKPNINHPWEGLIKTLDFNFEQYLSNWDEIYSYFSKEAVNSGALDQLRGEVKKNTKTLDKEFLLEISKWRERLAKNIALRNKGLSVEELNISVHRILDRLIFIKNLEDRGIEKDGMLASMMQKKTGIYKNLLPIFKQIDKDFNGLLFKKHFSETLEIDDKVIIFIIKHLSWPVSPYQFDIIKPEILGRIYEKFLGSKIFLTPSHRAKIKQKPEVRKAGGVYYTPEDIVNFIVKQTVALKIKGKTPEEINKIKIIDPSCGSGSFLLGTYDFLINFHIEWYEKNKNKRKYKNDWYETPEGDIRLSIQKKSEILTNNIFGIDIDNEATEVATMSLYLKMLDQGFDRGQAVLFKGDVLPDMSKNIKCGNSLIGSNYFAETNLDSFDEQALKRVNAFDWEIEFERVFLKGGFDCIIGNPPYVFSGNFGLEDLEKTYYKDNYVSGSGKINLFTIFMERSVKALSTNGLLSFIIPNTFLRVTSYKKTREYFLNNSSIKQVVDLGSGLFKGATTTSIIFTAQNRINKNNKISISRKFNSKPRMIKQTFFKKEDTGFIINTGLTESSMSTLSKLNSNSTKLGNLTKELIFGVVISKNIKEVIRNKKNRLYNKPFLEGRDIGRYVVDFNSKFLRYDKNLLHRSRTKEIFETKEKLLIQRITGGSRPLKAAFDNQQFYNKESINNLILREDCKHEIKYILGLINSKLINWFYKIQFTNESNLTVNISKQYLSQIPIFNLDLNNIKHKRDYNKILSNVDLIEKLNKKIRLYKTKHQQNLIQRQIDVVDRKIDALIYNLYNLHDNEIKMIENSFK